MQRGGRYNIAGNFIPASYQNPERPPTPPQEPSPAPQPEPSAGPMEVKGEAEESLNSVGENNLFAKPSWMKPAKKISKKERRRRQNEHLRRLITPKNALMVLNELLPGEVTNNSFTVEIAPQDAQYFNRQPGHNFCAKFTVDGTTYHAFGENKLAARNACAEKAIRDLVIKKMAQSLMSSQQSTDLNNEVNMEQGGEGAGGAEADDNPVPMIQVASYALHKLFSEWQCEGFSVPALRPPPVLNQAASVSEMAVEPKPPKKEKPPKVKELPAGAENMHPGMLLTHMRAGPSGPVYHEIGSEGTPPHMLFTMGVTVDGTTYIGKAGNKKEARKMAARSACEDIFHIKFVNPR